jgi:hypothetical protein
MTLAELTYNRLRSSTALEEKLVSFNNKPAIFYQQIPGDTDDGWEGEQYPRIDFTIDMQANPERQSSGQMLLDITCIDTGISPEEIETDTRAVIKDVFMAPDGCPVYCFVWKRSDSFKIDTNRQDIGDSSRIGITCVFDLLAFPDQETTDPDPVVALGNYIKKWEASAALISKDKLPDYYSATDLHPAFYVRLASQELEKDTNTVAWMRATLVVHIFAPDADARLKWLKYLADTLAVETEITMLDGSPMFFLNIRADSSAEYLTTGQLRLIVRYGILRQAITSFDKLNHISLSQEVKG